MIGNLKISAATLVAMMLLSAGSTTSVFPNNAQSEKKPEIPVALTKDLFEFSETPAISGY